MKLMADGREMLLLEKRVGLFLMRQWMLVQPGRF